MLLLLFVLVLFRIVCGLWLVISYFDPDEYWQAQEVAYCLAFPQRSCHLTWEWMPTVRIRGFAHPGVFAGLYYGLKLVHFDTRFLVAYGPRILQSALSAVGDWYVYKFAIKIYGHQVARLCLFLQCSNWFYLYAACRTYSNSMETVLTIIALYYWPLKGDDERNITKSLIWAALAVLIRPTAGAFWIILGIHQLFTTNHKVWFIGQVMAIALLTSLVMLLVDHWGYQQWTFVPYNFVAFNILQRVGEEYGVHSLHWYFTQCFPAILGTSLPMFIYGAREITCGRSWRNRTSLLLLFIINGLVILSVTSTHKELRFALPLVPVSILISGSGLAQFTSGWKKMAIITTILLNGAVVIFLARFHQVAPIPMFEYLASQPNATFVDLYTKCHATPYYANVHRTNITRMRFLDCSPNVKALQNIDGMNVHYNTGIEPEDLYVQDPMQFLRKQQDLEIVSHFVFSSNDKHIDEINHFLRTNLNKIECARFKHTYFPPVDYIVFC